MITVGTRVRIKDNYGGPTELFGAEGEVAYVPVSGNSLYQVQLDGERTWDAFFVEELEIIK